MSKSTSILIDDDFDAFIGKQIADGSSSTPLELVKAGLRLLKDKDDGLSAIRATLIEREESRIAEDFEWQGFLQQKRERHGSRK